VRIDTTGRWPCTTTAAKRWRAVWKGTGDT